MSPEPKQPLAGANLNALLAQSVGGARPPGMVALVLEGERVVAEGAAGVRKAGSPEAVILGDRFHLGSETKAMTATLAATLIEEGRLKWTTTLGEVFEEAVLGFNPAWRQSTLERLLTHRAGM